MDKVLQRAQRLAPTDDPYEPYIPDGLLEELKELEEEQKKTDDHFIGTDKAATPAERNFTVEDLERDMARARPQALVSERL